MDPPLPPPKHLDYGEQDENGVDLSLIRYLLSLTPRERVIVMNKASRDAAKLCLLAKRQSESK